MQNNAKNAAEELIRNIALHLQNTALNISKHLYQSSGLAVDRGVEMNYRLSFEDYNHLGMGLGIKAVDSIVRNTEIMRIPLTSGINANELMDIGLKEHKTIAKEMAHNVAEKCSFGDKFQYEIIYQMHLLLIQLLLNYNKENAFHHYFVRCFPKEDLTHPVYWPQELYEEISSLNFKLFLGQVKHQHHEMYQHFTHKVVYDINFQEYLWGISNISARKKSIFHKDEQGNETIFQFLLPVVDFINHSFDNNCFYEPVFDKFNKKSYIVVKSTKDIREGEQLFFNYGDFSNHYLLTKFGFTVPNNKFKETQVIVTNDNLDRFPIFDQQKNLNEFLKYFRENNEVKKKIAIRNYIQFEKYQNYQLMLYDNKFDLDLVKFLRIIFLENSEILNNQEILFKHDFNLKYSKENDEKVYNYLKTILSIHFNMIKDFNYSDSISSLGIIDSKDKYDKKNLYIIEEEEQKLLSKNLDYVNKKLNLL